MLLSKNIVEFQYNDQLVDATRYRINDAMVVNGITYEFCTNQELVEQYLKMRKIIFSESELTKKVLKKGQGWQYDAETYLLIARHAEKCIGGMIFTISRAKSSSITSLESPDFTLRENIHDIDLYNSSYSALGHLVLDHNFRNKGVVENMFKYIYFYSIKDEIKYIFSVSPLQLTRLYIRFCNKIGFPIRAYYDVEVPMRENYNGYKRYILCSEVVANAGLLPSKAA